jgi:hypothetical protein
MKKTNSLSFSQGNSNLSQNFGRPSVSSDKPDFFIKSLIIDSIKDVADNTDGGNGGVGPTGPQGITGPTGVTGSQGVTGPTGAAGTSGSQGVTGPTGADGAPGNDGGQGPPGNDGGQGPPGNDGAPGNDGGPGADGPPGATGPTGAGFNPIYIPSGGTISTSLTPGYYFTDTTLFLAYQIENNPWGRNQYIYLADNTLDSSIVYYGKLGLEFMGLDGLVGYYLSEIISVRGSPAEGQINSNTWTMSYAPVPGNVITRTVVNGPTYSVGLFDSLLAVTGTTGSTGIQIDLPLASDFKNKLLYIVDEGGNATTNDITIIAQTNEFILGSSSHVINTSYASVTLYSNGESPGRWFFV